jgi:Cu/Ag efflux pump CusA
MRDVPLSSVASIEVAPGPNQISRENGKTARLLGRKYSIGHATLQVEVSVSNDCALAPDNIV